MLLRRHRLVEHFEYRLAEEFLVTGILDEPPQLRWKGLDHDEVFGELVDEKLAGHAVIACEGCIADELATLVTLDQRKRVGYGLNSPHIAQDKKADCGSQISIHRGLHLHRAD